MLKVFRDNLKYLSWVLWLVIAVFILFVFQSFGGAKIGGSTESDAAATVGSYKVTYGDFERTYRQAEENLRRAYGQQFTPEMARQTGPCRCRFSIASSTTRSCSRKPTGSAFG